MKCANEVLKIANEAANIKDAQAAARKKREQEAAAVMAGRIAEEVVDRLIRSAESGDRSPLATLVVNTPYDDIIVEMEPTYNDYADKRKSYRKGRQFDAKTFAAILTDHCYKIETRDIWSRVRGHGQVKLCEVWVTPDPKC